MYGAQTIARTSWDMDKFENDVEMYGAQTQTIGNNTAPMFENDVEMYGAQTFKNSVRELCCLRMM